MQLKFLRKAIELSEQKMLAAHGGPFGAVIVKGGEIVGMGWNQVTSSNDPTAHAEMVAIRAACAKVGDFSLAGCQLYTSCEPCPMCLAASYWARVDAIYYAANRADAAHIGFDDSYFYEQLHLAPGQRALPMQQHLQEEACEVMALWSQKSDRISY